MMSLEMKINKIIFQITWLRNAYLSLYRYPIVIRLPQVHGSIISCKQLCKWFVIWMHVIFFKAVHLAKYLPYKFIVTSSMPTNESKLITKKRDPDRSCSLLDILYQILLERGRHFQTMDGGGLFCKMSNLFGIDY